MGSSRKPTPSDGGGDFPPVTPRDMGCEAVGQQIYLIDAPKTPTCGGCAQTPNKSTQGWEPMHVRPPRPR